MTDVRYEASIGVKIDAKTDAALKKIEDQLKRIEEGAKKAQKALAEQKKIVKESTVTGKTKIIKELTESQKGVKKLLEDTLKLKKTMGEIDPKKMDAGLRSIRSRMGKLTGAAKKFGVEISKANDKVVAGAEKTADATKKAGNEAKKAAAEVAKIGDAKSGLGAAAAGADKLAASLRQANAAAGATGLRGYTKALGRTQVSANRAGKALSRLTLGIKQNANSMKLATAGITAFGAVGLFGIYYTVSRVLRVMSSLSDTMTVLRNQMNVSTTTAADLSKAMDGIFKISVTTGTRIGDLAKIFQRFRLATRGIAVEQSQLIRYVDTLSKTISAFGIGAEEARGAMIQLAQGMGANRLSGQELNAVMEQLPPLAQELARVLGISTGQLREFANESGAIKTDVVLKALESLGVRANGGLLLRQHGLSHN